MDSQVMEKLIGTYVIFASIAVSLFVSSWNSIDPVNLPKMFLLGILAPIAAALAISIPGIFTNRSNKTLVILLGFFLIQLTVSLLFSPNDFYFHFYGTPGRNTGYFSYLSLTFLLFASAISSRYELIKGYVVAILGVGTFLALYGILQSRGIDFFNYVNEYGSNVFGTFGNPNFQSAFMGMTAAAGMTLALLSKLDFKIRIILIFIVFISVINISLSSEQGYLNCIAGFTSAVIVYLFSKKKIALGWIGLISTSFGGIFVLLGILNHGPLAPILYKASLQARGFYWQAALKMMLEKPFTGVGLDGFGDWYLRNRTPEIAQINAGIKADTAHNIPLDIGSGGGVILMALYVAIVFLAFKSIIKVVKRAKEFDPILAAIVAAWVAYQAQSLISINQLGLGVWGWSLTGLLIGYEIKSKDQSLEVSKEKVRKQIKVKSQIPAFALVLAFFAGGFGLALSLPPYMAAIKYYKALQSGDGLILEKSAYLQPNDRTRYLYTAQILAQNKLESKAIKILSDASKIYPDSFELWKQWAGIPSATDAQKAKALSEMKRLDPYNPDLNK